MKEWTISTADETWKQPARSFREAITKAFKRRSPKALGMLIQGDAAKTETVYCLAETGLKWAGLKLEA